METPTIESLMAARRDEARAALAEFNPKYAVVRFESNEHSTPFFPWIVSVEVDGSWTTGCGATFKDAVRNCRENLNKRPRICKVCFGRLDGSCKHTHEAQP